MVGDGFGGRLWYQPLNYSAGSYSAFTVCGENNQLYAWGSNTNGEFGVNNPGSSPIPIKVVGMDSAKFYSTGYMMCGIREDETGWVWKYNLGYSPQKVLHDVYFADASLYSCAFVKTDGTVWSVGQELFGSFGDDSLTHGMASLDTVQMSGITNAVRVAVARSNTFCLNSEGEVWGCGFNPSLGLNIPNGLTETPVQLVDLQNIVDIKAGTIGAIALDSDGKVWQWGSIADQHYTEPSLVSNLVDIVAISACADGFHYMALDQNKNCYAWGENFKGAFGDKTLFDDVVTPVLIASDVVDIMAGEIFSYIIKSDLSLWAIGASHGVMPVGQYGIFLNRFDEFKNIGSTSFVEIDPEWPGIDLCKPKPLIGGLDPDTSVVYEPELFYFPNAFSPNQDGNNDLFKPIINPNADFSNYSFGIYNRWGQSVFFTRDPNAGWDGRFEGYDQGVGVFFFRCDFDQNIHGRQHVQGELTLIR